MAAEQRLRTVARAALRILLGMLTIPVGYVLIALLFGLVPVNRGAPPKGEHTIHLTTNGVHLQLILPREQLSPALAQGLPLHADTRHVGFGWGDAEFYLNTPEWADLTMRRAVLAAFVPSPTLVHVVRHRTVKQDWIAIPLGAEHLAALDAYLVGSFATDNGGHKVLLPDEGYGTNDDFMHGNGHYTALRTCNTWVNDGLKTAGLPASLWTPFDFAVLRWYR